jgi:hypothetical protein
VVTTENPVAIMLAACIAASQIPSTGPVAISRHAPSPTSSKHAMMYPSAPAFSPCPTSSSSPAMDIASSYCPSILAGHDAGLVATISVPGLATERAQAPILSVMDRVEFGLITWRRICRSVPFYNSPPR